MTVDRQNKESGKSGKSGKSGIEKFGLGGIDFGKTTSDSGKYRILTVCTMFAIDYP
ncbi:MULTISPECIES: hypothetical protein [unclassified Microcoleus]|uniref:hypothetical protein n=1 Tax=unclassified Microcoleus TaxID=2642155 RepID=UPI0025EEFB15|nr:MULTISPECIES: hypothetical protein [unclassified Microcoleus]